MMMNSSPTHAVPAEITHRRLHVLLWAAQGLLAVSFLITGAMKLGAPMDQLISAMPWVAAVPPGIVRFIGLCELAGAFGVVLPAATHIKPHWTGNAAVGLSLVMGLAILFHLARSEYGLLLPPIVLGSLAVFVAWGRLERAPITPRPPLHV